MLFNTSIELALSECRGQKNCASYYGCDICFMRSVRHLPKKDRNDKRKKIKGATMVYPRGGTAPLRTHERHIELADRSQPDDEDNDYYGVTEGRSFLVSLLPDLDLVNHLVIDYMHNCLLGFVKTSFNLTFSGKKMTSYLTRFSHQFEEMRVPSEFPRKTRTILGNLKASEYRTIAIAGFVLFGNLFDGAKEHITKLRRFWLIQVMLGCYSSI